ncbi:hypothetical protein [Corynebacterium pygosceleis]|uniref:Secreted protein n=1 Tax=Corynebacterium pygosceleis TaxID=2800406 RepID=A0A9Q4C7Z1_9CORY|nr:hypothetical protein [Corynebacterium pygosceleis]MCK7637895.1 hypothetical protein [Corynebacterium pygosceleis]MCK7675610.1 hypothetical protein [Corynebacterium pygosceleis]MCL0120996.1 hypothetical protein [Corynebacterium pygosceleis]MCX7468611.1 hypothetical protein [Corynebacterium pygosceleis]
MRAFRRIPVIAVAAVVGFTATTGTAAADTAPAHGLRSADDAVMQLRGTDCAQMRADAMFTGWVTTDLLRRGTYDMFSRMFRYPEADARRISDAAVDRARDCGAVIDAGPAVGSTDAGALLAGVWDTLHIGTRL